MHPVMGICVMILVILICPAVCSRTQFVEAQSVIISCFVHGEDDDILYCIRLLSSYSCPQHMAFERRSEQNGIYMSHLKKYLADNETVENVLAMVAKSEFVESDGGTMYFFVNCLMLIPLLKSLHWKQVM